MNQHSDSTYHDPFDPAALLKWYVEMGVDETIVGESIDRYALSAEMLAKRQAANPQTRVQTSAPVQQPQMSQAQVRATDEMVQTAVAMARKAETIEQLRDAVNAFDGCPLKKTAMNTVFAAGNPKSDIMFIGEAPEAEEDRQGVPFVSPSGQLLSKMLHSCGLSEEPGNFDKVYLTNVLFWRPPGNRPSIQSEIAVCLPFVERQIELVDPKVLVLLGGAAAKAVLGHHEGISRLRGRWFDHSSPNLSRPVKATALFHPSYLLRSPGQKRRAWSDLLKIVEKLETL